MGSVHLIRALIKAQLVAVLLLSTNVSAQTWGYIFTTVNNVDCFLDPESIDKVGSEIRFMQLLNYPDGVFFRKSTIQSFKVLKTINCETSSYKSGMALAYSKMYAIGDIESLDAGLNNQWRKINLNTAMGAYYKRLCNAPYL